MDRDSKRESRNLVSKDMLNRQRHWVVLAIIFIIILYVVGTYCPLGAKDEDPWELPKLVLAMLAGVVAYFEYLRASRDSRVAKLLELHERFIETKQFSMIRNLIEAQDEAFLSRVRFVANNPTTPYSDETIVDEQNNIRMNVEQMGAFDEYLDFMQLVAYLSLELNFNRKDMHGIFGYWLRQLGNTKAVYDYIFVESFEFGALKKAISSK